MSGTFGTIGHRVLVTSSVPLGSMTFTTTANQIRFVTGQVRRLKIAGGEWLRWPGQPWEFHPTSKHFGRTT